MGILSLYSLHLDFNNSCDELEYVNQAVLEWLPELLVLHYEPLLIIIF
jgi:hypothetical protein